MRIRFRTILYLTLVPILLSGCFTGVESTKKITDKDVEKVLAERKEGGPSLDLTPVRLDSFPNWKIGKQFYVSDENAERIFAQTPYYKGDSSRLKGEMLTYQGYEMESLMDNKPKVSIKLSSDSKDYVYSTNKTIEEIKALKNDLGIPFLIDMDVVEAYKSLLLGNVYYVKTPLWVDENLEPIKGEKFVKIRMADVLPGDKVFPLKLKFVTENNETAYLLMATNESSVQNRSFDNLFSLTDIRLNYPTITDEHWSLVKHGGVALGMTKDECRLSLGKPQSIDDRPTYDGLKEYWFYKNGTYLIFSDGILEKFRK